MSLNKNDLLSSVPHIDIQRSRFNRSFKHTTTANSGLLVPFLIDDLNPGTTLNFDTSFVCRMLTPLKPVMDDAYMDIFYFFVPYRLLWDHWREFWGENTTGPWTQTTEYSVPHLILSRDYPSDPDDAIFTSKSLADHFGFPVGVSGFSVSQLPFRAYVMIWNEFFRNENTDNFAYLYKGDNDLYVDKSERGAYLGGDLLPVARMHDYFSDCLPTSQKLGTPAGIPWPDAYIPVGTGHTEHDYFNGPSDAMHVGPFPLQFGDGTYTIDPVTGASTPSRVGGSIYSTSDNGYARIPSESTLAGSGNVIPTNLWADTSLVSDPLFITVNALRQAFAIQRFGERLAYGGSRYIEQLQTFYGLSPQDSRLQRPEFLGSQRFVINMSQVLQTSETSTTPQGNTAAYSLTGGSGCHVSFSSQEHGIVMGLFCIRHDRSYQQGLNRCWSRRSLYDFYNPCFANLGNMAVLNKEIYIDGQSDASGVFGYQEQWAEYRYLPNVISAEMRSSYSQSLDAWHYGDYYTELPTLSQEWMAEGSSEIGRTLALEDSSQYDQFLLQFHANIDTVAPMPLYSVPGLIDHF